jgi:catalase
MFLVGFELSDSIQKDREPIVNLYLSSFKTILVLFSDIGIPPCDSNALYEIGVKTTSFRSTQEGRKPIVNFKFKPPEWTKGVSSSNYKIDYLMQASIRKKAIQKLVRSIVNSERTD